MNRRHLFRSVIFAAFVVASLTALPARSQTLEPKRNPDLADFVEGQYFGDVISNSRGSSPSGVGLTLTRVGKNKVQTTSDYTRLPVVEVTLTHSMQSIVQANGHTAFVIYRAKGARHLNVSFDSEVRWSGD